MPRDRRGAALVLVLWLIVVLSVIAAGVLTSTRTELRLAANLRDRAVARYAAESGQVAAEGPVTAAVALWRQPEDRARLLDHLADTLGALREVTLGHARFGVTVVDLNTRIDLNWADGPTLTGLFSQFTTGRRAEALAAAVQDWRDPDDEPVDGGAEARDYARAGLSPRPRNAPFRQTSELRLVLGMSDSLYYAVTPFVTVDGDGRVNLNAAPAPVLAALPAIGPREARAIVSRREAGEVMTSAAGVVSPVPGRTGAASRRTLSTVPTRVGVVSRGWVPGSNMAWEITRVLDVAGPRPILYSRHERNP